MAACVFGLGEYLKIYAASKTASSTRQRVFRKSSSVSVGNPTIISVVNTPAFDYLAVLARKLHIALGGIFLCSIP